MCSTSGISFIQAVLYDMFSYIYVSSLAGERLCLIKCHDVSKHVEDAKN